MPGTKFPRRLAAAVVMMYMGVSVFPVAAAGLAERWTPPPKPVAVESVLIAKVDGRISIDPQGMPIDDRIDTELTDQVRALLDKAVRGWRFEPVLIDGRAVSVEARMRVTLAAREHGDGLQVSVDNVIFPSDDDQSSGHRPVQISRVRVAPPKYPGLAASMGVDCRVLLHIRVSVDGSVADVVAVQSSIPNVSGSDPVLGKLISQFEESAIKAARMWKYEVTVLKTQVTAMDLSIAVPVEYRMVGGREPAGTWLAEVRGPKRVAPWLQERHADTQQVGVSDVSDGEMVYLASPIKLATEVHGTVL